MEHSGLVVFVGFWGVADPLTTASFLPTIEFFRRKGYASGTLLATVERGDTIDRTSLPDHVEHAALLASRFPLRAVARAWDLWNLPRQLEHALHGRKVALFVARSTLAGAIPLALGRGASAPYIVESAEPHTEYMVQCGNWSERSLSARVGAALERSVLRNAAGIMTVSGRYADRLRKEGADPSRIRVIPCTVDLERFKFVQADRERKRRELGWDASDLVAVYLGKFGGMYHDELAFKAFGGFQKWAGERGRVLVLTPTSEAEVRAGCAGQGVDQARLHVLRVAHGEVPAYLSACDLAFSTYKGTPASAFLSPVKNGEYWANGLPVIMTRGVADDSDQIAGASAAGALFDPGGDDLWAALQRVSSILAQEGQRANTMEFARKYRSRDLMEKAYDDLLLGAGLLQGGGAWSEG